ncbi:MAG: condensation domain-containing protein [Acidobacteria bacterium]|nr:condensation domain-containing protein [Acidobacteriota bacterium]
MRTPTFEGQLAYWQRQMAGAPPLLDLPFDRPRPAVRSFRGAKRSMMVPATVASELKALGQREGVTIFMTLLAVFQLLLSRYSRRDDIVVGTDVANRNRLETEGVVGFFVDNLIMRTDLSGDPTFVELLQRVREVALGAYAHQDVSFGTLVEALRPDRSLAHTPIFQVLFVLQNTPAAPLRLPRLVARAQEIDNRKSKFDLALFMTDGEQGLSGTWVYRTDLFDDVTIARAAGHFGTLLEDAVRRPDARVSQLDMLTEAERSRRTMEETERQQSTLSKLRGAKRKAVNLAEISSVKTSSLREGDRLPLVIQPDIADINLAEWATNNQEFIETSLLKHGGLLFRGFGLSSVADFEQFVQSICPELFEEYGDLPREGTSGKIYKSTPYPADRPILFHNESSHMHRWPRKIWFHCVTAAQEGGETPIIDCREVYRLLDPAIRDCFAQKHLMYVRNYTEGLDVSWESFFQTSNRSAVEDYCRKASLTCEWKDGNGLRTRQVCPAVVKHPKTGEMTFFNQIQLHHVSCLEPEVRESLSAMFAEDDLPRNVYYGDGSPIEDSIVQEIVDLYWRESVAPTWQSGDVMMLDNMLIAHARNPFAGERKIVVAMGELVHQKDVETAGAPIEPPSR